MFTYKLEDDDEDSISTIRAERIMKLIYIHQLFEKNNNIGYYDTADGVYVFNDESQYNMFLLKYG